MSEGNGFLSFSYHFLSDKINFCHSRAISVVFMKFLSSIKGSPDITILSFPFWAIGQVWKNWWWISRICPSMRDCFGTNPWSTWIVLTADLWARTLLSTCISFSAFHVLAYHRLQPLEICWMKGQEA